MFPLPFHFFPLFFLSFLNVPIISSYSTNEEFYPPINETEDSEKIVNPEGHLDIGRCSCDLSNVCNFRCCCDLDCNETIREKWKKNYECLNVDYKYYNYENNCGVKISQYKKYDQFFNLMCIHRDNSPDMGEFYGDLEDEKEGNDKKEKEDVWGKKYKGEYNETKSEGYGILYESDSNGNCVKTNSNRYKNSNRAHMTINRIYQKK